MSERARALLLHGTYAALALPLLQRFLPGPYRDLSNLDVLWMVGGWALLPTVMGLPANLRHWCAGSRAPMHRPSDHEIGGFAVWYMILIFILLVCLMDLVWLVDRLRLRTALNPLLALLLGVVLFGAFHLGWDACALLARRVRGHGGENPLAVSREVLRGMRPHLPRTQSGRGTATFILLVNPFVEELAFRGVLVLLVAEVAGPVAAILLGLLACLCAHLYQGPRALPFHAAFYASAVVILLGDAGMWGAFGFHLAGDLVPWIRVSTNLRTLKSLRAARAAAHPGPRGGPGAEPAAG